MKVSTQTLFALSANLAEKYPYSAHTIFQEALELKPFFERIEELEPHLQKRLNRRMANGY